MKIIAKKSLGQNFLIDNNIIKKIINCANIKDKEILEVGPGTGNLTKEIIKENPKKIYLIEKDSNLIEILKSKLDYNIKFIHNDILKINENEISDKILTVFGNLPYNISTKILTNWILNINQKIWFDKLILMFQKEVADRIIAEHNNKNYGRLSVMVNWKLNTKKIIDIKPHSFKPIPKVDSSLLVFEPKKEFIKFNNKKSLETITRIFFSQRRKKIKKSYFQIFKDKSVAEDIGLDLDLRPQNINKDTFLLIAEKYDQLRS